MKKSLTSLSNSKQKQDTAVQLADARKLVSNMLIYFLTTESSFDK